MKKAMKAMKKAMKKDFEQRAMAEENKESTERTCKMSIKPICGRTKVMQYVRNNKG